MAKIIPQLNVSTSIVDFLKSQGQPSSLQARGQLAGQQGIANYTGTAAQNTALLQAMQRNLNAPAQIPPAAMGGVSAPSIPAAAIISQPSYQPPKVSEPAPAVSATASAMPISQPQSARDEWIKTMQSMQRASEKLGTEQPPAGGLSPEEKQVYSQTREQLQTRYNQELEALKNRQIENQKRLLGRYTAMGFSEPGAIAGPMASEPGIVTKGLEELQKGQEEALAQKQQLGAEEFLRLRQGEAEAERLAKQSTREEFRRQQEAMLRNLQSQIQIGGQLYEEQKPQTFTLEGRVVRYDPSTQQYQDMTPAGLKNIGKYQQTVEINGRKVRNTYDAEGNIINSVDMEAAEKPQTKKNIEKEIFSTINATVDQYKLNPTGFRENLIELLTGNYGEEWRDYIVKAVYRLMPDIEKKSGEEINNIFLKKK